MSKAILHSVFSLRDGVSERETGAALHAFNAHLIGAGYVSKGCIMRRQPLAGFDSALPVFTHHATIQFHSLEHEQACYEYLLGSTPPEQVLHAAMYSLVRRDSAKLFLTSEFESGVRDPE